MDKPKVAVVIPCYNEEKRLDVDRMLAFTDSRYDIRFLLVNDGSTDNTQRLLEKLCEAAPERFDVHRLERNVGKAEAVRRGLQRIFATGADYAGYWDADLATPLDTIPEFCAILDEKPQIELVLGARVRLSGRVIRRKLLRHFLGRGFATMASLMLGIQVYDHICGAKLFRLTHFVAGLFGEPFIGRWTFDAEIVARAIRGRRDAHLSSAQDIIWEVPLSEWTEVGGSKVSYKYVVISFIEMIRIYLKYIRT